MWRPVVLRSARMSWMMPALVVSCLVACGGDDGGGDPDPMGPNPTDEGELSATIDDQAWIAAASTVRARAMDDLPGAYEISGTAAGRTLNLELYNIDAPGTYPLGVTPTVFGGYATVARVGAIWYTRATGNAGEVTITELTEETIAGSFRFLADAFPGTQASGSLDVASGEFDIPIEGKALPVPENTGGKLTATLGETEFHASTISVTRPGGIYLISALNNDFNMGIYLDEVTGPDEYLLSSTPPTRVVSIVAGAEADPGTNCCWTSIPHPSGRVVIESLSVDRMVGTFEFTLTPNEDSPATDSLVVVGGRFDLGLIQR